MAGSLLENQWKDRLKGKFLMYFNGTRVLDIGSADINGVNTTWFDNCRYVGLDVLPYKNVNVVCKAHEYKALPESFDVVLSTSSLEHDMYWELTLKKMVKLLKPKGLMFFSAGANDCGEHGTKTHNPLDSLTTRLKGEWPDYYKNITIEMVKSVLDLDKIFEQYDIYYPKYIRNTLEEKNRIYFWGIKKFVEAVETDENYWRGVKEQLRGK